MSDTNLPDYVGEVLSRLDDVRPTRDGWDARCPCPDHNAQSGHPGDHRPSLRVAVGEDGRILIKCRVGCKTDSVLEATGLQWQDLFPPSGCQGLPAAAYKVRGDAGCDNALTDRAYRTLLENLELSEVHHQQLLKRGVPEERITVAQYRTLRNHDRGRAARAVCDGIGEEVLSVPGFVQGEYGVTLAGTSTGLLVPVRTITGDIQALKIRRDSEPKYVYLTGGSDGGSCGSPVHVPLGIPRPAPVVRVTEGELKADVSTWLDAVPTIGVPGVTQWQKALPVLRELEAKTVVIAFDAPDVYEKAPVYEQARALWRTLLNDGYEVEMEDWYAAI